jgi:hypothetical protein
MRYQLFHNLDTVGHWSWKVGDRLARGWAGEVDAPDGVTAGDSVAGVLERVFMRHNADDRPDGQRVWSLSVGDVVVLGETAWACKPRGWEPCSLDAGSVVADVFTDDVWSMM